MGQITITLPDDLREMLSALATDDGFTSPDAWVEHLIRSRQAARLRALIDEGLASPIGGPVGPGYFEDLRREILGTG